MQASRGGEPPTDLPIYVIYEPNNDPHGRYSRGMYILQLDLEPTKQEGNYAWSYNHSKLPRDLGDEPIPLC